MAPESSQSSSASRAPGRKSVLFCPTCGHESLVEGDWQVQAHDDVLVYGCPACGEDVTERPAPGATAPPVSSSSHNPSADSSLLARSVRLAFAWTVWPCTPAEWTFPYTVGRTPLRSDSSTDPVSATSPS